MVFETMVVRVLKDSLKDMAALRPDPAKMENDGHYKLKILQIDLQKAGSL